MKKRYIGKLIPAKLLPKNEKGYTMCRWCNNSVFPPRRTMCSPECAHQIRLRQDGRYLRTCVYKRDKGICAICNIDTKLIARNALQLYGEERNNYLKEHQVSLKRKIWKQKHGGGLWDADHIIPVKEGGGRCGLENLRTLCLRCHKIITKSSYKK